MPIQKYIQGSREFIIEATLGNVPGYSVYDVHGYNDAIDANSFQTIWPHAQLLQYSNTGVQLTFSSDSTDDTDTGGIGARDVAFFTINRDPTTQEFYRNIEVVKMTGTTPINSTATDIVRVWAVLVRDCGSNQANVGTIYAGSGTVTAGVPATIYGSCPAGTAEPYVPGISYLPTELAFMSNMSFSVAGNKSAIIQIVSYGAENIYRTAYQFEVTGSLVTIPFNFATIPTFSSTDIQIRAKASSQTVSIFYSFQIVLASGRPNQSSFID